MASWALIEMESFTLTPRILASVLSMASITGFDYAKVGRADWLGLTLILKTCSVTSSYVNDGLYTTGVNVKKAVGPSVIKN